MSVDERRRLEFADAAKQALGDDAGITLMEMLPPVGWADVATKQDLAVLRRELGADTGSVRGELGQLKLDVDSLRSEFSDLRGEFSDLRGDFNDLRGEFTELRGEFKDLRSDIDIRLERGFREILVTVSSLIIGGFLVAILAVVAAALLR